MALLSVAEPCETISLLWDENDVGWSLRRNVTESNALIILQNMGWKG